jgi:hypothetical protein
VCVVALHVCVSTVCVVALHVCVCVCFIIPKKHASIIVSNGCPT